MSDSLQPHRLQHARLPCPSPSPGVCSNSRPSSWWCHPTILVLCHPLLLLPSIFLSIRVFSSESVLCTRWPKYWSFSFSISPSNEYPELISLRIDWFDLFALQGTLYLPSYWMDFLLPLLCGHILSKMLLLLSQLTHVWLSDPWTVAQQAPLSMKFPRQEYWCGFPLTSPEDLPDSGSNPYLLHLLHSRWVLYHWAPGKL